MYMYIAKFNPFCTINVQCMCFCATHTNLCTAKRLSIHNINAVVASQNLGIEVLPPLHKFSKFKSVY